MVSGVSSRPPWSIAKLRPTIASTTSVDNSAPPPGPASLERMREHLDQARTFFSLDAARTCASAPARPGSRDRRVTREHVT